MRKFILFLLTLCLCLSLFSCNERRKETESGTPKETSTESETPAPTESLYHTDSENNLLVGEISIDNYRDYQKFTSEVNLPEHFIKYEDIASLGKFKRFFIYKSGPDTTKKEMLLSYNYYIELEDGFYFHLVIYLPQETLIDDLDRLPNAKVPESEVDFSNMRNLKKNDYKDYSSSYIDYNCSDVVYTYFRNDGTLAWITFYKGDYSFQIRRSDKFSVENYPNAPDTPIGKLLNIEDNDPTEVVASITKNIKAE